MKIEKRATATMSRRRYYLRETILLAAILANASVVTATVSYDDQATPLESMPAHFGKAWTPPSRTYPAHLQLLPNNSNTKLCDGMGQGLEGLVFPNDTLPVVLLVERGDCSFEQKANIAMQEYPAVSYMIIYDDKVSKNLVAMRETSSDGGEGISLGMLFLSRRSGMALRAVLNNQTDDVLDGGGPIIYLDGLDPIMYNEPSLADLQTWILIAMGGFFTFVTVFGCLLVFVQLGIIPVNGAGQIILSPEAIRRSRRLLTTEEVARLQHGGDLYGKLAGSDEETQQTMVSPSASIEEGMEEAVTTTNDSVVSAEVTIHPSVDEEEDQSCAVCLDELVTGAGGEENSTHHATLCLPCNHHFHVDCIVPWLTERQGTCPLCKFDLLQHIIDIDEKASRKSSRSSWYKQQAGRLRRFGWSPVAVEGSDSESQNQAEASTSSSDNGSDNGNTIPTSVVAPP